MVPGRCLRSRCGRVGHVHASNPPWCGRKGQTWESRRRKTRLESRWPLQRQRDGPTSGCDHQPSRCSASSRPILERFGRGRVGRDRGRGLTVQAVGAIRKHAGCWTNSLLHMATTASGDYSPRMSVYASHAMAMKGPPRKAIMMRQAIWFSMVAPLCRLLRMGERSRLTAPRSRLLLRLRLNGRTPREEMIERRVQLIAVQNPRCTLRLNRPRERHSQISANELAAHAQRVCDFLRPRVFARTHRDNRVRLLLDVCAHLALLPIVQSAYPIARLKYSANRGAYARLRHQSQRHTMRLFARLFDVLIVHVRDRWQSQRMRVRLRPSANGRECQTLSHRVTMHRPPRRAPKEESRFLSRRARAQRVRRISRAQIEAACAAGG